MISPPRPSTSRLVFTFGSVTCDLASRTHIMGILNVTPDSFSDGGKFTTVSQAVDHGKRMVDEGADFLDVGGESTRPGSDPLPVEEELQRVLPVIRQLARECRVPISVDTYKAAVAEACLSEGAVIVNDISALTQDAHMARTIAKHGGSAVLMHMRGTPRTMQQNPAYSNVTREVSEYLGTQAKKAQEAGITQIAVDPGIGFGKNLEHNLQLIRELRTICSLGYPVLIGPSRKSFLGTILDLPVTERLEGTAAAVAVSIMNGANVVRVHDVREMKRVAKVVDALR
ncbi:MAG: dihydropteroate synthase [Bacteroidota bacterium]